MGFIKISACIANWGYFDRDSIPSPEAIQIYICKYLNTDTHGRVCKSIPTGSSIEIITLNRELPMTPGMWFHGTQWFHSVAHGHTSTTQWNQEYVFRTWSGTQWFHSVAQNDGKHVFLVP